MKLHCIVILILFAGISFGTDTNRNAPIIGIKIYDHKDDSKQLFDTFTELGINTVFASETLVGNSDFREQAKAHRIKIFVIEPIFYDPEALKADPDLYAITRTGERAKEDWVEFVCPSRDRFRKEKVVLAVGEYVADQLPIEAKHLERWFTFGLHVDPIQSRVQVVLREAELGNKFCLVRIQHECRRDVCG